VTGASRASSSIEIADDACFQVVDRCDDLLNFSSLARSAMSVLVAVSRPAVRFALSLAALLTKSPGSFLTASAAGKIGSIIRPIAPG